MWLMIKKAKGLTDQVLIRLDASSKDYLSKAAEIRKISVSDYVRQVTVLQAKREVEESGKNIIALTPEEQEQFWHALNEAPKLTKSQKKLRAIAHGKH